MPAGPQRVLVSGATARHTTAERVRPASEQAVTDVIAEEAVTHSNTRAAANTTIHTVGEAVLLVLVPAGTEAAPSEEESQAVPASLVSIIDTENYRDLQENFRAYNFFPELEIRAVGVMSRAYNQGTYGRCAGMARRSLTV